jgi:hypothetical protein
LDSERKVARKGVQARFQARLFSSANPTRDSRDSRENITFFNHVFLSRLLITFSYHVFYHVISDSAI